MKRVFEIEFPDELGEMWMNQDNLMLCINAYCENNDGKIKATDITSELKEQDNRQLESERMLNREAAFDEQRLRDEVEYWKGKNYRLG